MTDNFRSSGDGRSFNNQDVSIQASKVVKKNTRIKPKFFKLLGQIMNQHIEVFLF